MLITGSIQSVGLTLSHWSLGGLDESRVKDKLSWLRSWRDMLVAKILKVTSLWLGGKRNV